MTSIVPDKLPHLSHKTLDDSCEASSVSDEAVCTNGTKAGQESSKASGVHQVDLASPCEELDFLCKPFWFDHGPWCQVAVYHVEC